MTVGEAQNDNRGGARKDGGREGRFFAALRMTMGVGLGMTGTGGKILRCAQNDKRGDGGAKLLLTKSYE